MKHIRNISDDIAQVLRTFNSFEDETGKYLAWDVNRSNGLSIPLRMKLEITTDDSENIH